MKIGSSLVAAQAVLSVSTAGAFVGQPSAARGRVTLGEMTPFRRAASTSHTQRVTPLFASKGGEPSRLERYITPKVDKEAAYQRQEDLMDAIEANPYLEWGTLLNPDIQSVYHLTRAACTIKQTPVKHYGIPTEARRGHLPKTFLEVNGDEFKSLIEKGSLVYNQGAIGDLLHEVGLDEKIDINGDKPFTEQFEPALGEVLGIYQKEFFLGLAHGIDPINSSICAGKSAWLRGSVIITPQIAEALDIDYEAAAQHGEPFEFSDENRGVVIKADELDQGLDAELQASSKVAEYFDKLELPAPKHMSGCFGTRVFHDESFQRMKPKWEEAATTLVRITAETWPFPKEWAGFL